MSTAAAPPVVNASPIVGTPEDETFTIPGLSWDQYVTINDALGDRAGLRTLFFEGTLTFVSPAYVHEWSEDALDKVILAVTLGCGIEMSVIGSTTLRRGPGAGLEGDRVYYLRDNVHAGPRPERIDLEVGPAPDLAVEVENTHQATDAMAIYARLGVPEVWRHDARRGALTFWSLRPDGTYEAIVQSLAFPFLTPVDVLEQLRRAGADQSSTRWFRQLTEWVRDVIAPRLDQP